MGSFFQRHGKNFVLSYAWPSTDVNLLRFPTAMHSGKMYIRLLFSLRSIQLLYLILYRQFRIPYDFSTAVNDQIGHFYDRSLKICRITNIAEIIISRYGSKSNSILVDVMEYDMRSTRTSIVKKWEIE